MKILAIDIETKPTLAFVWRAWKENIMPEQVVEPGGVICFAARFLGEKKMHFYSDHHDGHERMIQACHELLSEADVVLHFNGRRFDVPHLNREFVEMGMRPPAPFKQIDLLETVKARFRFLMNRLAHVAPQLGLDDKVEHEGFKLWVKCMNGDEQAWAKMKRYNIRDVKLLEDAYEILQPWVKSHPSHGAEAGKDHVCPRCGSDDLKPHGTAFLVSGKYQRYECNTCGGWSRGTRRIGSTGVTAINE